MAGSSDWICRMGIQMMPWIEGLMMARCDFDFGGGLWNWAGLR